MDTITHGIIGALAGKALFAGDDKPAGSLAITGVTATGSPTDRAAIMACTIGSIFPDIDIFAGRLAHNPLAIMEWHRNITHSIVLLPAWALFLAVISLPLARWLRWPLPSFPVLVGIYAAGLASHVFLDLITDFGTMVWSPLSYSRLAWDWLFILDLSLTSFALVPQIAAWCYRAPRKWKLRAWISWAGLTAGGFGAYELASTAGYPFPFWIVGAVSMIFAATLFAPKISGVGFQWSRAGWCRAGLMMVCIYVGFAGFLHGKAVENVNRFIAANHIPTENSAAFPLPPTLTHWSGMIATPEGVLKTTFHLPGGVIDRAQLYASTPADPHVEEAKKLRDVQVYLWFARFPIWHVEQRGDRTVVDLSDVRFFRDDRVDINPGPLQPKRVAGIPVNSSGFIFEIIFDAAGQVVSHEFKRARP